MSSQGATAVPKETPAAEPAPATKADSAAATAAKASVAAESDPSKKAAAASTSVMASSNATVAAKGGSSSGSTDGGSKGANWHPPTPEPTSTKSSAPKVGKVATFAGVTATSASTSAPKAASSVSPYSAGAVVEEKMKPATAMDRVKAIGSVLSSGAGAKAEPAQQPKTKAQAAPRASGTAGTPGSMGSTMSATDSVLGIVSGRREPALETTSSGYTVGTKTMGSARTLAAAAASQVASAMGEAAKVGPQAVAAGRAIAQGGQIKVGPGGKPTVPITKKFQVVFVTSEVAPYSKTGGLGEAMDGLPCALAALGHRVMVISPRYDQYSKAWDTSYWSSVTMGGNEEPVHFFHTYENKVDLVFVDHPTFLERVNGVSGSKLYGPEWGKDFADNQSRFAYFCKAALVAVKNLSLGGFPYGDEVMIVANDWHSALVPMFIAAERETQPGSWTKTKTALLCHNAVFQGRFEREEGLAEVLGVPQRYVDSITFKMPLKVGKYNKKTTCVNTMAAGLRYADRVLTVSPSYALEVAADPEKGVEIEALFAAGRVTGILNGVKEGVSPSNKNFVTKTMMSCGTYTPATVDKAKDELKEAYRMESGLPACTGPLMTFVGRLDAQKGYDLLIEALSEVLDDTEMQVVVVGAGRADLVQMTRAMEKKFPNKFFYAGWMGPERYSLLAGSDYTLLPSRWEPCGLVQMEAMRMGTLPIVAPTGGLKDTVEDGVNGLWTDLEMTVEAELEDKSIESIAKALRRAAKLHIEEPEKISTMRKGAMAAAAEFTWSNAALQYEMLFEELGVADVIANSPNKFVTLETDKQVC